MDRLRGRQPCRLCKIIYVPLVNVSMPNCPTPLAARVAIIVVMNFEKTAQEVADLGVASIGFMVLGEKLVLYQDLSQKNQDGLVT